MLFRKAVCSLLIHFIQQKSTIPNFKQQQKWSLLVEKYTSHLQSFSFASIVGSLETNFKLSEIKLSSYRKRLNSIWQSNYLFLLLVSSTKTFTHFIRQLRILQNHHIKICRSVELLNESFGTILLLEMFFIFTCFTNYLIKILVIFNSASTYSRTAMVVLLFGITGNLALICISAELIRAKVWKNVFFRHVKIFNLISIYF